MGDIFTCPKCNEKFDADDCGCKPEYYEDNEDECGNHKWDVFVICPHCAYEFWDEVWD